MKNKIACTTGGYHGSDLDRVFLGLSRAGFKYVELSAMPSPEARIPLESMTEEDLDALKASLKSHELVPVSLSGHSDLSTAEGVAFFKRRIDFAHDLGMGIINTGAAHGDSPQEVELFYAHMQEIIPYARERDVRIALETHGGMTGTAPDCLRTLERLRSDWVGINYDTANVIYYRGVRPEEDIPLIAPYVIHVHLKDKRGGLKVYDFPPLGEGNVDFASIVETLAAVGYAGPYSAEIEMEKVDDPEQEDKIIAGILGFMEHLLGDS
jgi:sugar phosphate isomerase/epimerase